MKYPLIRLTNLLIILIIFVAHFFAPLDYRWTMHTMSELAAQGVPNAWLLTSGFMLGGLSYVWFGLRYLKQSNPLPWLLPLTILNGVLTFLLGVFPTSYDELLTFNPNELIVVIHRYIAYASNLVTLLTIILHATASKDKTLKMQHLFFLVFAFIFSGFFILYQQEIRGIFQRLILLTTSVWMWTSFGETTKPLLRQKQQKTARSNV